MHLGSVDPLTVCRCVRTWNTADCTEALRSPQYHMQECGWNETCLRLAHPAKLSMWWNRTKPLLQGTMIHTSILAPDITLDITW